MVIAFERALDLTDLMLALVDIHSVVFHAPKKILTTALQTWSHPPSPHVPRCVVCI